MSILAPAALGCNQGGGRNDAGTDGAPMEATGATEDEPEPGATTTGGDEPAVTSEAPAEPACGDGLVEGDELCDGAELGGMSCADIDPGFTGPLTCASDCQSFDMSGCEGPPIEWVVALNELTSKGAESGPYAGKGDAIELLNAGAGPADLSGWRLSDDPLLPADKTYVFPAGTTLMPGERLVLVELDPMSGEGELPFGLSASNSETLTLVDGDDAVVDALTVEGAAATVSWCRLPDGTGPWSHCEQTLGAANTEALTICGDGVREGDEACDGLDVGAAKCADRGFAAGAMTCTPQCGLDTSMCASDLAAAINELESTNDEIELFNAGADAIDMSGWILTDQAFDTSYDPAQDLEKLVFVAGTALAPGQFMVIEKGEQAGQHMFGLSAKGDTVTLLKPDLTPVSQVTYGADQAALSFCRLADGPQGSWSPGCKPTFGAANAK